MIELSSDDAKLVVLARSIMVRTGSDTGAAVRDLDGRTFSATKVDTVTMRLTALQAAVATALANGATGFEAAAVVDGVRDDAALPTIRELSQAAPVYIVNRDGRIVDTFRVSESIK
jgi:cytidine deaminase